ncbi:MAG: N-acetylglucosamine-6-phosphate deacetylase [Anaerovibrio sp.]
MEINNVLVYTEQHEFVRGGISFENGMIKEVSLTGEAAAGNDVAGDEALYAIPGLVDIHFHGCMGADLCDAEPDTIKTLAEYQAGQGVTTICPATMTMSLPELHKIMANIGSYTGEGVQGAHLAGINMEGPFISPANKGAQAAENIIPCDANLFRELNRESGGRIRLVDIAPEEPGALEFIEAVRDEVNVSLAHTVADYDDAMAAFRAGANHVTHLFNAMLPFHHRKPGVQGAAADAGAYVELICDGVHIHPAMVRAVFKLFGSDRVCLISDSMRAAGLADGDYTLGGQAVKVKGNLATLADGTIAGSVTNLMLCLKNAVQNMQIPLEEAVRSASETPARSIGIFDRCGSLSAGKRADIVLLDRELNVRQVFVGGRAVK